MSCRACLRKSKSTTALSELCRSASGGRSTGATLRHAFNSCTGLKALHDDDLPQNLCVTCARELQSCFRFWLKANESDARLRALAPTDWKTHFSQNQSMLDEHVAEAACYDEGKDVSFEGKDPLEETDDEKMEQLGAGFAETDSDDEDDNKPLQLLLNKVKATRILAEDQKRGSSISFDANRSAANPSVSNANEDIENLLSLSNEFTEEVPEVTLTPEAQIFPQGRFKCRTCAKTYFTTVGLEAHLEVHLPKSTAAKKRRIRGPNKKKRKPNATLQPTSEVETDDELKVNFNVPTAVNTTSDEPPAQPDAPQCSQTVAEAATTTVALNEPKTRKPKPPKPKKMFPCNYCSKHMISASKLRYHMVMHTGEKNYLCTICPKAYSTIYALKHHMRTHTGERPYECKFCGDKFLRPTTLKSHMRRHTGERPYGCDICGKRFIQHSSMATHMKLNHMAKTIPCPHCDKKYARQTDLNTHLLSHTGNKPFFCQLCPSRFIRQANLNKHMNQQHSPKPTEAKCSKASKRTLVKATKAIPPTVNATNAASDSQVFAANVTRDAAGSLASVELDMLTTQSEMFDVNASAPITNYMAASPCQILGNLSEDKAVIPISTTDGGRRIAVDGEAPALYTDATSFATRLIDSEDELNRWTWPNHA